MQWQISFLGGFTAHHDARFSLDNIGWDGRYGIQFTTALPHGLGFKMGLEHDSSHLGDEYMERTGRKRIGYTRQELNAGASWFVDEHWRTYAEAGFAFSMGDRQLQEPWRAQIGIEYESSPLFGGPLRWYTAIDSQAMQERQWRVDLAVQTGIAAHSLGRTFRIGVEWYNGRPPVGEFFQYTERSLGVGVWMDI